MSILRPCVCVCVCRDLAKRLFLDFRTPQECEEYFIKFIEKSELDAKIDSQQNHIVLATDITNPCVLLHAVAVAVAVAIAVAVAVHIHAHAHSCCC